MKELKTVKKYPFQLVNKLTLEMDKFRKPECRHFETYVFDEPIGKSWFIRYPGATRGKIVVDENMIIQKMHRDFLFLKDYSIIQKQFLNENKVLLKLIRKSFR